MKQKEKRELIHRSSEQPARKKSAVLLAAVVSIAVSICAAFLVWAELEHYESGVLDVCAAQQDAYVQLVLDQINLKENRSDEEIITGILSSLDASSNKYWTFSKDQAMIFVKDVLETNKYKGFTASTYYSSESAQAFLQSLLVNRVTHGEIEVNGGKYIASGVAFKYGRDSYRICLLTNRRVLLDNNLFLEAKVGLSITAAVLLILFCVTALSLALYIQKLLNEREDQKQLVEGLNKSLVAVNERLSDKDIHDARTNLWKQEAVSGFLEKLLQRKAFPFNVVKIGCPDSEGRKSVLLLSRYLTDRSVLKFEWGSRALVLLFIQAEPAAVDQEIASLLAPLGAEVLYNRHVVEGGPDLSQEIEQELRKGD